MILSNKRIAELYQAFAALSQRSLAAVVNDNRVAYWFSVFKPLAEARDAAITKTNQQLEAVLDADEATQLEVTQRVRKELDELDAATFEVPTPTKKLTEADMPKRWKGGEPNVAGVSRIKVLLAPEFYDLANPDAAETPEPEGE